MNENYFFAFICSVLLVQNSSAVNLHPAVQAELQKCVAHGIILTNITVQSMKDTIALEKLRKNAKTAVANAETSEQKAIAKKANACFFEALKKDQTKVENPELVHNFFNAIQQAFLTFIATASQPGEEVMLGGQLVRHL